MPTCQKDVGVVLASVCLLQLPQLQSPHQRTQRHHHRSAVLESAAAAGPAPLTRCSSWLCPAPRSGTVWQSSRSTSSQARSTIRVRCLQTSAPAYERQQQTGRRPTSQPAAQLVKPASQPPPPPAPWNHHPENRTADTSILNFETERGCPSSPRPRRRRRGQTRTC